MDPDTEEPLLPASGSDKPFVRQLSEFKFWYKVTVATIVAMLATFFEAFNVPVYWPVLVFYFCGLLLITMRRQIAHMVSSFGSAPGGCAD